MPSRSDLFDQRQAASDRTREFTRLLYAMLNPATEDEAYAAWDALFEYVEQLLVVSITPLEFHLLETCKRVRLPSGQTIEFRRNASNAGVQSSGETGNNAQQTTNSASVAESAVG